MAGMVVTVLAASALILGLTNAIEDYQNVALQVHNQYRAAHQADDLSMDGRLNNLATQCAQYYLNRGTIDHTCPYKGDAGENLSWNSDGSNVGEKATTSWYDEYKMYNFNNPGFSMGTGHFTQVVWKESKKLGFGIATGNGRTYAVALYSPPGNFGYNEDYARNVLRSTGKVRPRGRSGESSSSISYRMIQISSYKYCIIYSAAMYYVVAILL